MKSWKRKTRPLCNCVLKKKEEESGKLSPFTGYFLSLNEYILQFLYCAEWLYRPLFHTWDYAHSPSKHNVTEHLIHAHLILDVGLNKKEDNKHHDMREKRTTSESEKYIRSKC